MRHVVSSMGAAAAILLMATGAWGEESNGASLTIGEVASDFVLNTEQSDWSGSADFPSVSITLSAGETALEAGIFSLRLGFEMAGGQMGGVEASLLQRSSDATESLYCNDEPEHGDLTVDVESTSQDGDALTIKGTISCELGTSESYGNDIDLSDPVPLSGDFDVTLQKL